MELAHNIGHGQWDWMNDPKIHSTSWEWDMVGVSVQWRYSHNPPPRVHQCRGRGRRPWLWSAARHPRPTVEARQICYSHYDICCYQRPLSGVSRCKDLDLGAGIGWGRPRRSPPTPKALLVQDRETDGQGLSTLPCTGLEVAGGVDVFANATANLLRNLWAYTVICCGHFADGAETFDPVTLQNESEARTAPVATLGSANFRAGPCS